jgi:hypothetical protein
LRFQLNFSYTALVRGGSFASVDDQGRWQEVGSPINPTLVRQWPGRNVVGVVACWALGGHAVLKNAPARRFLLLAWWRADAVGLASAASCLHA